MPGRRRAVAAALLVVVAAVLGTAGPAGADPARPTDYRSVVLLAHPSLPGGVHARVVGGDSFLELQVARGHRVVVPDYSSGNGPTAPYLRFRADGVVERNRNAVATAANRSRYGAASRTPDPTAPPSWERVATDGRYAWHDHRIHWMAPRVPRVRTASGRVDLGGPAGTWEVALVVDGRATTLVGELVRVPPPSPMGWILVACVAGAAVLALVARRPRGTPLVGAAAILASGVALVAAWAAWSSVPAGAGAGPAGLVVTAAGLVAALVALAGPGRLRMAAWAGAAAALLGWAVLRLGVLVHAVLPTSAPAWFDRAATALALGVGAAIAAAVVWRPPLGVAPGTPEPGGESPPLGG